MSKLKPCPFCGGEGELTRDDHADHAVQCNDCGAWGPYHDYHGPAAVAAWNRRACTPHEPPPAWISAEERRPEVGSEVLAWHKGRPTVRTYHRDRWEGEHHTWLTPTSVTHWMPLPDPAEGKQ